MDQTENEKKLRVLIADDVRVNCRLLQGLLSDYGESDIVHDGREAVTAFQKAWEDRKPYNLICLDIYMPALDGLRTLAVIRKMEEAMNVDDRQRACIVMVTSESDSFRTSQAKAIGCDGYIVKPIHRVEFLKVLDRIGLLDFAP